MTIANLQLPIVGPTDPIAAVADDPFRPAVCPRCEYDLAGLPAAGACPECGRAYGPSDVVYLYVHAADRSRTRFGVPIAGWGVVLAVAGCLLGLAPTAMFVRDAVRFQQGTAWSAVLILLLGGSVVVHLFIGPRDVRQAGATPGTRLSQIAVGPDGVRQLARGVGPVPFADVDAGQSLPWYDVERAALDPRPDATCQVAFTPPVQPGQFVWRREGAAGLVRCSPAGVVELRARIAQWRAAAVR